MSIGLVLLQLCPTFAYKRSSRLIALTLPVPPSLANQFLVQVVRPRLLRLYAVVRCLFSTAVFIGLQEQFEQPWPRIFKSYLV